MSHSISEVSDEYIVLYEDHGDGNPIELSFASLLEIMHDIRQSPTDYGKEFPEALWVMANATETNARLSAAAPEMVELLKTILTRLDLEPVNAVFPNSALREDIRTAINNATAGR